MIIRSEYFHKHGLKIRDKIVIASKEVLKDNKTVVNEMLKYADQVHTLKSKPKDVIHLTNTEN